MTEYLRIGIITSPHGVHGEVRVYPTTDDPARFRAVKNVRIETKDGDCEMEITSVKYFKNMVLLGLSGIGTMDEAEKYRNANIMIHRSQSPLKEGEHFICDLLGLSVYREDGSLLGTLEDVLTGGSGKVYSVRREDGKEVLIPAVPAFIKNISIEEGRVDVRLIGGMEE